MTPRVWTNLDPRGMVGSIYVGDHWTLLYIKYISCGPELKWCNSDGSLTFKFFYVYGSFMLPLEFQSSQPKKPYASFPLPYVLYMKFDHNSSYILL